MDIAHPSRCLSRLAQVRTMATTSGHSAPAPGGPPEETGRKWTARASTLSVTPIALRLSLDSKRAGSLRVGSDDSPRGAALGDGCGRYRRRGNARPSLVRERDRATLYLCAMRPNGD